ncbi:glycosyltransferase [Modestobacter sp. VKM Ac-2979]|uniref:glycosyltransferase n=1 Tax=unclassified Modestobacter TaxID=2643866 RepID=UPI0022ABBD07|nr:MULTISPECIES: glycosyltransferase [unclassified Modestobacter]MCZ2812344.1 glycosyltransferase [Modestobacter sp. VKM Ac-2979]MCZ2841234.1 glycosyltransferase [Modestobacter sp. VKM Ac-2980]
MPTEPLVSVVLVNYKGAEDTITCLRSLGELDWPADQLELIVVDNDSGGDDVDRIRREVPGAVVIEAGENSGFAGGCNTGVRHARGEVVGFINNDARPDPQWVRAAVDVLQRDRSVASVASKVLDWEGTHIDYVDGSLTWFGMGYKREVERPDSGEWETPRDVLFGTGAAMFVRKDVYETVGGFDERFFMFYEDVDLGWRLNLLGWRVRYVPDSIAFHKHHASMKKFGSYRETFLLERNALFSMIKNYGDDALSRTLAPALMLAISRAAERGEIDPGALDLKRSPGGDDIGEMSVPKVTMAGVLAIADAATDVAGLWADRARLQEQRTRNDLELAPLFRQAIEPAFPLARYLKAHGELVESFGIADLFATRRRILVITGDPLAAKMAGPAMRAWAISEHLSDEHDVRLVSTSGASISDPRFAVSAVGVPDQLKPHEAWADIIVFQGFAMAAAPWLVRSQKIIVCDIYDPMHLEQLEQTRGQEGGQRTRDVANTTTVLNQQLSRGDFFLCASEKQRHFWLGQMAAVGRLNPATYDADSSMSKLLAVVPFGLSSVPPRRTRPAIKGVVPGIAETDKVVLWAGGVYNWFDPLTLVRAIDQLRQRRPDVRMFFLGMRNPNPHVPEMRMAAATRELSDSLGLTGKHVFFNEEWVDFRDRENYLLDADVGVSTHFEHVETTFSFRTRMLDYLWAQLPIVATGGDTFGDLISAQGLGVTVPEQDVDALAEGLERTLYDEPFAAACRDAVDRVRNDYAWERALSPLLEFCRAPRRAPDLAGANGKELEAVVQGRLIDTSYEPNLRGDLGLIREYMQQGGPVELGRRVAGRIRKNVRGGVARFR